MYFPGLVKVNINGGINLFEGMPCVKFTADVPRKSPLIFLDWD